MNCQIKLTQLGMSMSSGFIEIVLYRLNNFELSNNNPYPES